MGNKLKRDLSKKFNRNVCKPLTPLRNKEETTTRKEESIRMSIYEVEEINTQRVDKVAMFFHLMNLVKSIGY